MARHPMRPDDLGLLRWAQDPHLSPDASRVAWTEAAIDLERDEPVTSIFVGPADGSAPPRCFAPGPHALGARWSPDGRHLAYLSADGGPPSLKLAPLDGGEPSVVAAPGPVKAFEWSPGGDRIVLVVNVRDEAVGPVQAGKSPPAAENAPRVVRGLFNRLDGMGFLDGRDHLFVHDLAAGSTSKITSGDYDHAAPAWSPDGGTIAFVSDRTRRRDDRVGLGDIWALALGERRAPRRLATDVAMATGLQYSPDGARLAFTGVLGHDQRAARDSRLMVIDADGSGPPQRVAPGLDRPTGYGFAASLSAWLGDDELLFTVADGGTIGMRRARLGDRTARVVLADDRQVLGLAVAGGAQGRAETVAFASAWVDSTGEVYTMRLDRRSSRPARVSDAGARLAAEVTLNRTESFSATAPDGMSIEYFVLPGKAGGAGRRARAGADRAGGSAGTPPIFVDVHGGPAMQNPIVQLLFHYQVLAGAGYTVVMPNPRGSVGYGETFTAMSLGDWGEGPLGDVLACADDAIERGLGDAERQFIGGYSYGGYMSSYAVGQTGRFRAAAIGAPVTNLFSEVGAADVGPYLAEALGADPWTGTAAMAAQAPLTHAPAVRTPVLLHVNEGDLRCPPSQCDEFYTALKWHGQEVEYVRYPGGSHLSFFTMAGAPSQNQDRAARILALLARNGGIAPED